MKGFEFAIVGLTLFFITVFSLLGMAFSGNGFDELSLALLLALMYLVGFSIILNKVRKSTNKIKNKQLLKAMGLSASVGIVFAIFVYIGQEIGFLEIAILILSLLILLLTIIPEKWLQKILEELGLD